MNQNYLTESIADYNASLCLLKDKNYARALYCFQQSVEKSYKYICLESGAVEISDLRNLSHNVFRSINKLASHYEKTSTISDRQIAKEVEYDLKILSNQNNIAEIVANVIELTNNILQKPPTFNKLHNESYVNAFYRTAREFGIEVPQQIVYELEALEFCEPETIKQLLAEVIEFYNTGIKIIELISTISIYTNHFDSNKLRYPSEDFGSPSLYFDSENIYIKALPNLLNTYHDYILIQLDKVNWGMV